MYEIDGQRLSGSSSDLTNELGALAAGADDAVRSVDGLSGGLAQVGVDAKALERTLTRELSSAFEGMILDGESLGETLDGLGERMARMTVNSAIDPVASKIGSGLTTGLDGALAAVVGLGKSTLGGGISERLFNMNSTRPAAGEAQSLVHNVSKAAQINMNISTPDAQSFQRSQGQIVAGLGRMMARGNRLR